MPALSLFSKASSLFARKEFPVMSHREFIGNYLILRIIPSSVSSPKRAHYNGAGDPAQESSFSCIEEGARYPSPLPSTAYLR
jgi:hypothetical protein